MALFLLLFHHFSGACLIHPFGDGHDLFIRAAHVFVDDLEESDPAHVVVADRVAGAPAVALERARYGLGDLAHGEHRRAAFGIIGGALHVADHLHEEHPYGLAPRLRAENVGKLQNSHVEAVVGKREGHRFLIHPAADVGVPFREFLFGPDLREIRKIGTADHRVAHAAFLGDAQHALERRDIVFFKKIVDRRRSLHTLVHTRGEDEAFAALKVLF